MLLKADKNNLRQKRHLRVRNHIHGTSQRPRLQVFTDSGHIYVKIIDDEKGVILTQANSADLDLESFVGDIKAAECVGFAIARRAIAAGITEVVLDSDEIYQRSNVRFLLMEAREGGLKF